MKRILLFLFFALSVWDGYAYIPKDDDKDYIDEWDSLKIIRDSLKKEKQNLSELKRKADKSVNIVEKMSSDSLLIIQYKDSIKLLSARLNPMYIKFAEKCAIKYANNKLYYPYDPSIGKAIGEFNSQVQIYEMFL